jgi:hypothetical protein
MTILLFLSAFSLSSIAAYYAIMGLMAIFSGAPLSIAIMGGALEVSKLVVTSWLYRNWKTTSLLLKSYFLIAIVILMCLTSMGIFGYLSKAHNDQSVSSGGVQSQLALIDEKINFQKEIINDARKTLNQLDSQVTAALERTTDAAGTNSSVSIRRSQGRERGQLTAAIGAAQGEINRLNEERAPVAKEARKVEAEVGPIKYIAQIIYGEEATNEGALEKAVRIVILMIVGVFDPLAVLMFIALNQTIVKNKQEKIAAESDPALSKEVVAEEIIIEDEVEHKKEDDSPIVQDLTPSKTINIGDSTIVRDQIKIQRLQKDQYFK